MINRPQLGAIAIVIRNDQVLLAKRRKNPDSGLWGFPGGHVELGETALAAAARELQEETGIVANPIEYLTNIDLLIHNPDGSVALHYLLAGVLCDYVSGTLQAADDVSDARWFNCDDVRAGSVQMSERVAEFVDMALARLA
ncbi:MAG: NUDIX hydrolase [Rhodobacteraceae bacterium]|nr:NUDIX hydrolase [Paracoccaceae bacterium]